MRALSCSLTTFAPAKCAVENALLLEWLCAVYRQARSVGEPRVLDDEPQAAVVTTAIARKYGTTRQVNKRENR